MSPTALSMLISKDAKNNIERISVIENKRKVLEDMEPSQRVDSDKLKSEVSPGMKRTERPRIPLNELIPMGHKNKSNNLRGHSTPLNKKSNGSESLIEDSFFLDFKESENNTPMNNHKSSRKSCEEQKRGEMGAVAPLPQQTDFTSANNNISRQNINSNISNRERSLKHGGSQRLLNNPGISHAPGGGQSGMKMDMKFGWRPRYDDRMKHNKEAVAIKLTYPKNDIGSLLLQSMRVESGGLSNEIYRNNKNYRAIKKEAKVNFIPGYQCRLVYQGYRPAVSLELHLRLGQKLGLNEDAEFYDVLIPKKIKAQALDSGLTRLTPRSPVDDSLLQTYVNPAYRGESALVFDSQFESGNLDLAIQVQPREFNLYLRPDTNTKGYCNWFFFKVTRKPDARGRFPPTRYSFSILNLYKKKTLYRQEAKPLVCFQEIHYKGFASQDLEFSKWQTGPFSNIGYGLATQHTMPGPSIDQTEDDNNPSSALLKKQTLALAPMSITGRKQKFYCLAFDFEFPNGQEFAYIASSIPYQYTFLQKTIRTHPKLDQSMTTLTRTLGGLQLPLLTITNEVVNISKKRTVIICGRIHPGETNSSWVLHGIIDFLISKNASHLRDNLVFKIVPMVNPDGVVVGNYRSSFIGKDLNRLYLQGNDDKEAKYSEMHDILKPEIKAMQQLIKDCKASESKGILAFIDVHHHSQKRGAFMFGPCYPMQNSKYMEVRVLPKLCSMLLPDMFRFQSCKFKNQSYKENCARLFCDKEAGITYSYCLECSQQGFYTMERDPERAAIGEPTTFRHVKQFDQSTLMEIGRKACEALHILNELCDVQDLKRDAINKRRKQRTAKKQKGKKGKNGAGLAGKGANSDAKIGDSEIDTHSQEDVSAGVALMSGRDDWLQTAGGGIDPKLGIKGFISQMMTNKGRSPSNALLLNDSARSASLVKKVPQRPMTHFCSQDAVSEKSEKDEESLSGSDGGSSGQDLSEDEQQMVLEQVLDELMPNRERKQQQQNPVVVVKITEADNPVKRPPLRRGLKSANRIVLIDKKAVPKEQLVIPKALLDYQLNQSTNALNFSVGNHPYEPVVRQSVLLGEEQNRASIALLYKSNKEENKKTVADRQVVSNQVHGCYLPSQNQGYISQLQKQKQSAKRIQSSRAVKRPQSKGIDLFANSRMPPKPERPPLPLTNINKLMSTGHFTDGIYSMVQQPTSQASSSQPPSQKGVAPQKMTTTSVQDPAFAQKHTSGKNSAQDISQPAMSRQNDQVDYLASLQNDIGSNNNNLSSQTSQVAVGDNQQISQQNVSYFKMTVPSAQGSISKTTARHQNYFSTAANDSGQISPELEPKRGYIKNQPIQIPLSEIKNRKHVLSSKDAMLQDRAGKATEENYKADSLASPLQDRLSPKQNISSQIPDRKLIPLSQGGFFHRNQIVSGGRRELGKRVKIVKNSPAVILNSNNKNSSAVVTSELTTKRHPSAAVSTYQQSQQLSNQHNTPYMNRLVGKRASAHQLISANYIPNNTQLVSQTGVDPLKKSLFPSFDQTENSKKVISSGQERRTIFSSPQKHGSHVRLESGRSAQLYSQTVAKKTLSSQLNSAAGPNSTKDTFHVGSTDLAKNQSMQRISAHESGGVIVPPQTNSRARMMRQPVGSSHNVANTPYVVMKRKSGGQTGQINKIFHKKSTLVMTGHHNVLIQFNQTQLFHELNPHGSKL